MTADFTFDYYEKIFSTALINNYQVITLKEFFNDEYDKDGKVLINRIDVDIKINRLHKIYFIFNKLKIKASIFFRLHASEYNLLTISNIKLIKKLIAIGCEISLHTEMEDVGEYCEISKEELLVQEIKLFEIIFGVKIYGTAAHGDMTKYNNLDFWEKNSSEDFGLLYEAYDKKLWNNCRYVSDSEWTQWKTYENGALLKNDRRSPTEHMNESSPKRLHLLTHPESFYDEYIYE